MSRPKAKAPARQYHISGQSVVRIGGKDFYLGEHDSPGSIARYAVLIGIYQKNGLTLPDDFDADDLDSIAAGLLGHPQASVTDQTKLPVLVQHVTALYREHVAIKCKNSKQERLRHVKLCDQLDVMFSGVPAAEFGPLKLKQFRDSLVEQGLARKYVNRLVCCVIAMFTHAVSCELIDVAKVQQLQTLEPLRCGQTEAHETEGVLPADLTHVRATAAFLSPIVKAMLRVQIATGMRPIEVCIMRPCDIDRSGDVWIYVPISHKTKSRGKSKAVPIVGDALEAVTNFLNRDPKAFFFHLLKQWLGGMRLQLQKGSRR